MKVTDQFFRIRKFSSAETAFGFERDVRIENAKRSCLPISPNSYFFDFRRQFLSWDL